MEKNWLESFQQQNQIEKIMDMNVRTEQYGLTLSQEDAKLLAAERQNVLREQRRIEFAQGIMPQIIYEFCDSAYIDQNNYVDTLIRLQEIFYLYKNEMLDEITDDELLHFMKEQFETVCFGDLNYLEGSCLDIFAQAIRAGYDGYRNTDGYGEYSKFDEVQRWDREVYLEVLRELFWG
ncbi:DUF6323 family protein [Konateibacter massiliensis]|uniref:DUF6323 family protein n=1 Tax=Konateibacter massiliensis TaxID=2002841 RepID=UPI000C145284|nr:DUF6323 family protein [Konateibacter massiliensis]